MGLRCQTAKASACCATCKCGGVFIAKKHRPKNIAKEHVVSGTEPLRLKLACCRCQPLSNPASLVACCPVFSRLTTRVKRQHLGQQLMMDSADVFKEPPSDTELLSQWKGAIPRADKELSKTSKRSSCCATRDREDSKVGDGHSFKHAHSGCVGKQRTPPVHGAHPSKFGDGRRIPRRCMPSQAAVAGSGAGEGSALQRSATRTC